MEQEIKVLKPTNKEDKKDLRLIRHLSRLMDSQFTLPGTKFKFGLDPILGLIPGVGDVASYTVSGLILYYVHKYGVSRKLMLMMLGNVTLDAIIGSIPILGQIFDFYYKANDRNLRLLQEHYEEGKHQGKATWIIVLVLLVFLALVIFMSWLAWAFVNWIISLF